MGIADDIFARDYWNRIDDHHDEGQRRRGPVDAENERMQDVLRDAILDVTDSLEYITTVVRSPVGCAAERYNVKVCTHVVDSMLAQRNMVGWVQQPKAVEAIMRTIETLCVAEIQICKAGLPDRTAGPGETGTIKPDVFFRVMERQHRVLVPHANIERDTIQALDGIYKRCHLYIQKVPSANDVTAMWRLCAKAAIEWQQFVALCIASVPCERP